MSRVTVMGTGYVGLITGVCLAEIGHSVTCIDIAPEKIEQLRRGISPIFEPGLTDLIEENLRSGNLWFTNKPEEAIPQSEFIFIAVGTPQREDGSADLTYIQQAAKTIGAHLSILNTVIVTKSTVPVGTNGKIEEWIKDSLHATIPFDVVSNPEFLREGSAIQDTFQADRIVIGSENEESAQRVAALYEPMNIPIFNTNRESAELIKYASNAFLATKISFINEIANLSEKLGADISDVAYGMGLDHRIGTAFLKAGLGYGGSCFPKDTNALVQIAGGVDHRFELLESVIKVNQQQPLKLLNKAVQHFGSLQGKETAILGLAFKPNTDDMREAASITLIEHLLAAGAKVRAYDPIAAGHAQKIFGDRIEYSGSIEECLHQADMAFIATEWEEIKLLPLSIYQKQMKHPVIFDGRNCYSLAEAERHQIDYYSIGRKTSTFIRK
ncbi:UDP-glucose dehydrogenase family protein [Falsibacillus albus]|uniref:UDP-glucose 6-dehydrogenase n=1 Tax=Falsibacillus albus TaxID=2478915 RepID=A0A3L7K1D4_9BACI|nr:UDP-glucose/GDP-mannose dehydrogenase family protein [Falsibacillus albus]RLQ96866.1 UDP-glucose/GDP-mannose dehydrogenase family protein [Falsibacillus albus]